MQIDLSSGKNSEESIISVANLSLSTQPSSISLLLRPTFPSEFGCIGIKRQAAVLGNLSRQVHQERKVSSSHYGASYPGRACEIQGLGEGKR